MATGMKVIGADAFAKKLGNYPKLVDRTIESVLKQEARAVCVSLGASTMPFGLTESPRVEGQRQKVEKQVRQVFLTSASGPGMERLITRRSPALGAAFRRARKEGNKAQMARYMADAGVSEVSLNPSVHRSARTSYYGGVEKGYQAIDLVPQQQLETYVGKRRANVGIAKAGWYAAAKALGGRIRRNLVADDGKRSTVEIFPAYIKQLARKNHGLGGAKTTPGRVEVFSNVAHARAAILDFALDDALYRAEQSFLATLKKSLARIRERGFRDAA